MKKLKKAALLQEYQNELLRYINTNPDAIYPLEWGVLTNGFVSDLVKKFVMGVRDEILMENLVEHLILEYSWYAKRPELCLYSDEECRYLKYGSPANPVRFDVYMQELKRIWRKANSKEIAYE